MALKTIFWVLALALLGSVVWHYSGSTAVKNLIDPDAVKKKPFVFDNGSVREIAASAPSAAPITAPITAPNVVTAMRKCQRGAEVIYTDNPCQKGFLNQPIRNGSVTVVEGNPGSKSLGEPLRPPVRPVLQEPQDGSGRVGLREKRIDRLVGQ